MKKTTTFKKLLSVLLSSLIISVFVFAGCAKQPEQGSKTEVKVKGEYEAAGGYSK